MRARQANRPSQNDLVYFELIIKESNSRDRDNYHMCDTILVQYLPTNAYTMMCATWLMMVATIQNPLWHAHGDADADIPNIALINATFVCTIGAPPHGQTPCNKLYVPSE